MQGRNWPIIIGGCHRSGTSLLRRMLNAHSQIHCGPEIKFFRDFYGDYPDDVLAPIRFMSTARSIVTDDELFTIMGRAFIDVHERGARREGKRRWADKAPENVLYLGDWQRLLGHEWLFVHVVRNPLDTLASIKDAGFPRTIPPGLDERVAFYRRYTQAGLAFAGHQPGQYHRVIYEQLVRDPEVTLCRLMAWLGEAFERDQLAFNDREQQAGLEDPKVARTRAVHAESIGRWADTLTAAEAAYISRKTADVWADAMEQFNQSARFA